MLAGDTAFIIAKKESLVTKRTRKSGFFFRYSLTTIAKSNSHALVALPRIQSWFINGVDNVNWPPYRDSKTDVSSVSPSSERIEELWVTFSFYRRVGSTLLVVTWQREK